MKVRLVDTDSLKPNLALCKLSGSFKNKGDDVGFYNPMLDTPKLGNPDIIYSSKIFNFTEDYQYYPNDCEIIRGGSGIDLINKLPIEIEHQYPDYDLYDFGVYNTKQQKLGTYAMGFTTRGCCNNCKFCLVPCKEGKTHEVADIYEFWKDQKYISILDNNLTSLHEKFEVTCKQLIKEKIKVDFSQGLDMRLIDESKAKLLSKVKLWKQIHFALDDIKTEKAFKKGYDILVGNGVKPYKMMAYVLIGFNSTREEDTHRIEFLRSLDVDPFVMPYKSINCDESIETIYKRCKFDTLKEYQDYMQRLARWANRKELYKTVKWENYRTS